jgi:hypothetical protein
VVHLIIPPAPPPPPLALLPPPPPATIKTSASLVPGCVVSVDDPVEVVDVIVHLPYEDLFVAPIIPPFADPEGLAI